MAVIAVSQKTLRGGKRAEPKARMRRSGPVSTFRPEQPSSLPNITVKDQAVGVTPQFEVVTPKKAEDWLNANTSNRKLRTGVVEKYARDMREGKWTTCTAPIVFYDNGEVADGQHRLWAIVEAGCAQKFLVVHGLDRASGLNIDMGVPRSLIDNAHISGVGTDVTYRLVTLCRAIEQGDYSSRYLTNADKLRFVEKHREVADWIIENGGHKKIFNSAIVNAAIGRAWYHEADHNRLARFGVVLTTGFGEGDDDSAAIALRNYLLSRPRAASASGPEWRDLFLRAQNAVWNFMRNRRLVVVKPIADERYPLKH